MAGKGSNVAPHAAGTLQIAPAVKDADALLLTATDAYGKELFTWALNWITTVWLLQVLTRKSICCYVLGNGKR